MNAKQSELIELLRELEPDAHVSQVRGRVLASVHGRAFEVTASAEFKLAPLNAIDADARLIELAQAAQQFVTAEDGYVYYWPKACSGALSPWQLRLIAEELERRNAPWHARLGAQLSTIDAAIDDDGARDRQRVRG